MYIVNSENEERNNEKNADSMLLGNTPTPTAPPRAIGADDRLAVCSQKASLGKLIIVVRKNTFQNIPIEILQTSNFFLKRDILRTYIILYVNRRNERLKEEYT